MGALDSVNEGWESCCEDADLKDEEEHAISSCHMHMTAMDICWGCYYGGQAIFVLFVCEM
jgi:hypothetical protein